MTPDHRSETSSEGPEAQEDAILRESEERVEGAVDGEAPADGADEHRRSEDTV